MFLLIHSGKESSNLLELWVPIAKVPTHDHARLATTNDPAGIELKLVDPRRHSHLGRPMVVEPVLATRRWSPSNVGWGGRGGSGG